MTKTELKTLLPVGKIYQGRYVDPGESSLPLENHPLETRRVLRQGKLMVSRILTGPRKGEETSLNWQSCRADRQGDSVILADHAGQPFCRLLPFGTVYRVVAKSKNLNSFGLRGMVLLGENGQAWEVATNSLHELTEGQDLTLSPGNSWGNWGFEIPRQLPPCPYLALKEIWEI